MKKLFQEALKRDQAYTVLTCLLNTHKHSTFCNMLSLCRQVIYRFSILPNHCISLGKIHFDHFCFDLKNTFEVSFTSNETRILAC